MIHTETRPENPRFLGGDDTELGKCRLSLKSCTTCSLQTVIPTGPTESTRTKNSLFTDSVDSFTPINLQKMKSTCLNSPFRVHRPCGMGESFYFRPCSEEDLSLHVCFPWPLEVDDDSFPKPLGCGPCLFIPRPCGVEHYIFS